MPDYRLVYGDELMHYGVKGMKWGHRKRSQYSTQMGNARLAYKKRRQMADSAYKKATSKYDPMDNSDKTNKAFDRAADKWASDRSKAKSAYKQQKANIKSKNIKDYRKKFDDAERASNIADKKWSEVNEQYKALGRNRVSRMINAARNKSDAAKAYNKNYDQASRMSDAADKKWEASKAAYKETGGNAVSRVYNNMQYDLKKRKKR